MQINLQHSRVATANLMQLTEAENFTNTELNKLQHGQKLQG